jgi:hypothetical protein
MASWPKGKTVSHSSVLQSNISMEDFRRLHRVPVEPPAGDQQAVKKEPAKQEPVKKEPTK